MSERARPRILVLMAAYNAGEHLEDQVESILVQDDVDVHLLISDDGSTDGTVERGEAYARALPQVAFRRNPENLGCTRNFMQMVADADAASYDYFAFADDDDFWLTDKLARAVELLACAGPRTLYYSDVTHVDAESGRVLSSDSPMYASCARNLGTCLVSNWAAGCTMVFDAELLRLLQARPQTCFPRHHDAWVHLVALSCAKTVPDLGHSSIIHRITHENVTFDRVERDFGRFSAKRMGAALGQLFHAREHTFANAATLLSESYGEFMDRENRELVRLVASLPRSAKARVEAAFNPALCLPTPLENALLKARILGNYL